MQRTVYSILFTFLLVLAIENWGEGLVGDILESFRSTDITCVGVNLEKWLDFGDTRNNATNSNQTSQRDAFHFSHGYWDIGGQWFEVEIAGQIISLRSKI